MRHKTQENAHCPSSTQKSAAWPPALCPLMSTHEPSRPAAGIPLQALVAELRSRCEAVSRFQGCSTESGGHSDGEHTRPRVFRSAPSRYGWRSGHSVNGFISDVPKDTRMSPARARALPVPEKPVRPPLSLTPHHPHGRRASCTHRPSRPTSLRRSPRHRHPSLSEFVSSSPYGPKPSHDRPSRKRHGQGF